jgi:hypothetical protein
MRKPLVLIAGFTVLAVVAAAGYFFHLRSSTSADLDQRWSNSNPQSDVKIDNSQWQEILLDYLITDSEVGVNLFDYGGLLDDGREPLDQYIAMLVAVDPLRLNRQEQKAYWMNLYNARTVQLILDHYPLSSITSVGDNPVDFGPWNDYAVTVNGIDLSLNDIEHRIIRPLYQDYRIHFAVNCASIGCPDLAAEAFSGDLLDQQLDNAANRYVNHPRGVRVEGNRLILSSLFDWYASDFGSNLPEVLATISQHFTAETVQSLQQFSEVADYEYDWSLNGYCFEEDECGT